MRETILDVEYPLIEGQLGHLDIQLDRAITSLNWKSDGKFTISAKLGSTTLASIIEFNRIWNWESVIKGCLWSTGRDRMHL